MSKRQILAGYCWTLSMEPNIDTAVYSDSPLNSTNQRTSLKALTGVRFFAAIYVVLYHTKLGPLLKAHGDLFSGNFFMSGYLAVSLFFVLSGFILAYTYAGQINQPGAYLKFWQARFARVWPVYVVSLLLTSIADLAVPKHSYILPTFLMLQAWNPFDRGMWGAWNYVCWTLSVEVFFYLCFPWYQDWLRALSSRSQLMTVALALALAISLNSGVYVIGFESHGVFRSVPLPLMRLPEFVVGVGLGNYFLRASPRLIIGSTRKLWLIEGLCTYTSALLSIALLCRDRDALTTIVLIPFAALVFGLAAERTLLSRFLSSKMMLLGGGISYSIYLLQAPAKDIVMKFSDMLHVGSLGIRVGVTLGLLLTLSTLSFKIVEGPARLMLRSLFERLAAKRIVSKQQKFTVPL